MATQLQDEITGSYTTFHNTAGSITAPHVFIIGGSLTSTSTWTGVGSVVISGGIIGSVAQSTDPWRITGSVTPYGVGSVQGHVPLSGTPGQPVLLAGLNQGTGSLMAMKIFDVAGVISNVFVTIADTNANTATLTNEAIFMGGDEAHDATDAGNPLKIGGKAQGATNPTAVAVNDRVDGYFDLSGRMEVDNNKAQSIAAITGIISGNLAIVGPATGSSLRIRYFHMVNNTTSCMFAGLRFSESGTIVFCGSLEPNGGQRSANLINTAFEGATNNSIFLNQAAAGSVNVTIMGENFG